ncbi:MAG: FAD-dependent oxidoreductase [Crocinitomicaceae bacterium]|nr:FAD-dependent oxidoreductase [Crocinitomicaceae bacterium]
MKDQHHNVVIIGTSPLAITEAVWQKSKGKSVVNIDDKAVAGGAWTNIKHDGIPAVEIGCHIWEVEKSATDFLKAFYDLNLVQFKPQPRILKKGSSIPYGWKLNLSTLKYVLKRSLRFEFKRMKAGLATPEFSFSIVPRKYLYPKGGANELHAQVMNKIESEKLDLSLNTELKHVKLTESGIDLKLKNGDQSTCDKLILTSLSSIETIEFEDGSSISPETKQVDYIHVHLLLETSIPKAFSYERWMDDEYIHRVSDMTSQVSDELESNQKLLCVGIHAKKYHASSHETLLEAIIERMKNRKLIEGKAKLVQHGFNVFPSYYNSAAKLTEIEARSNGKISVLRSTSFTYSFFNHADRFAELVNIS